VIPHTNQLDETTGLHMTGTVQEIDQATYSLKISGLVDHLLELRYDDLRARMPKASHHQHQLRLLFR
jgi:DMSO/TMAO reductase YedYZ molybdopterin-dependent catalytic subunit